MTTKITPKEYAEGYRKLLEKGECTLEWANQANHIALETKVITLEHFQEAARLLVKERLKA